MIRKRPLCVVWIVLMTVVWLMKAAGIPIFGEPRLNDSTRISADGNLYWTAGGEKHIAAAGGETCIAVADGEGQSLDTVGNDIWLAEGIIASRQETITGFRYVMKRVRLYPASLHVSQADQTTRIAGSLLMQGKSAPGLRIQGGSVPGQFSGYQTIFRGTLPIQFPKLMLRTSKDVILKIGAKIQSTGEVKQMEAASNPGQFDARAYYACNGIWFSQKSDSVRVLDSGGGPAEWVSILRNRLTHNLAALLPDAQAGVLSGMLLGERLLLDDAVKRNYQIGGIMHILAISGLHISMLGMNVFMGLQRAGLPLAAAAPTASAFMLMYCLLVGNPASAIRAMVMFAVMMGAYLTKRSYDLQNAMALAGIIILLQHPGFLFQAGYQLSFMAVTGISIVQPALQSSLDGILPSGLKASARNADVNSRVLFQNGRYLDGRLASRKMRAVFINGVISWGSISAATIPLVAYHYYEVPLLSFPVNFLLLPFVEPLLMAGAVGAAASLLSRIPAGIFLLPARLILTGSDWILTRIRRIPCAMWICGKPAIWQILLYYGVLWVMVQKNGKGNAAGRPKRSAAGRSKGSAAGRSKKTAAGKENRSAAGRSKGSDAGRGKEGAADYRRDRKYVKKTDAGKNSVRAVPVEAFGKRSVRAVLYGTALVILLCFRPGPSFSFTALDVGQGDSLVIRVKTIDGARTFLSDGGSTSVYDVGCWRIIPYLKHEGIRTINGIFLSHEDEDHINGIQELLQAAADGSESFQIKHVYLPAWMQGSEIGNTLERQSKEAGADAAYLKEGEQIKAGELCFHILHPLERASNGVSNLKGIPEKTPDGNSMQVLSGNEGSMVMKVTWREFDLLLTGDLEEEGEENLIRLLEKRQGGHIEGGEEITHSDGMGEGRAFSDGEEFADIDCLKVAHHGSKYSTSDRLLNLLQPEIAVISAGKNNRYGHPHQELLDRLGKAGSKVFRTDQNGAVTVTYDGTRTRVFGFVNGTQK